VASQLTLYNDALLLCGERALSSLTENREPRRLLDQVWDNGGVDHCLELGQWYFAIRTVQIDFDTDVTPDFGFTYAFSKPTDWILTAAVCSDEHCYTPLVDYTFEDGYWYSETTPIYVRYVSNGASYGNSLADWPVSFKEFAAAYFASKIVLKVTSGDIPRTEFVLNLKEKLERDAKSSSAMAQPVSFPPVGSWIRSRSRYGTRRDRGNQNGPLIG